MSVVIVFEYARHTRPSSTTFSMFMQGRNVVEAGPLYCLLLLRCYRKTIVKTGLQPSVVSVRLCCLCVRPTARLRSRAVVELVLTTQKRCVPEMDCAGVRGQMRACERKRRRCLKSLSFNNVAEYSWRYERTINDDKSEESMMLENLKILFNDKKILSHTRIYYANCPCTTYNHY